LFGVAAEACVDQVIRDGDFLIEIGRATGGRTFVRVVHQLTNCNRRQTGLNGRSVNEVSAELTAAVVSELLQMGWVHETEPS
jgi:hypothetical protein